MTFIKLMIAGNPTLSAAGFLKVSPTGGDYSPIICFFKVFMRAAPFRGGL
jgi:hypothetical protein